MPEDLQRTGDGGTPARGTLFDSTSRRAGEAAARSCAGRRQKILAYLAERGPACLFEIAAHHGWFDHQISGRFTELAREGLIERTGARKARPDTGCEADVWRLRAEPFPGGHAPDGADAQGYPATLVIPGDGTFHRAALLKGDDAPGIPYSLSAEAAGLRLSYRVALVECDGCGRPVRLVEERGAAAGAGAGADGKARKTYRCGTPGCNRTWHLQLVHEPGRSALLALVLKTH